MQISNDKKFFLMGNEPLSKDMTLQERIENRKGLYAKQAMHLVTSADKAEKQIDKNVAEHNTRIEELLDELEKANTSVRELQNGMEQLKEEYGIEENSKEQQDLELMQKAYDARNPLSGVKLTEDEIEKLATLDEPTEYQSRAMEMYEAAAHWKEDAEGYKQEMRGEIAVIRSVKIQRLKMQGMADAQRAKEELLEAASKEAMGMLIEDAKSQIDKKAEETIEAAKEQQEKKEVQEERIEAVKENKSEIESVVEQNRERVENMTEQVVSGQDISSEMKAEIKKIIEEEKLLEEDLKGLLMDTEI